MKTSEKTPDNTLAAPDKVSTVPQKSQQESNAPQLQSPQMTMDLEDHAAHVTRPRPQPPSRPQVPPGYQPTDTMANESILVPTNIGLTGYVSGHVDAVEEELPDEFFDNDTSSEAELRQAAVAAWADSPGTATDVVNQSSDDFGDDVDDIRDDEEDEEDDDDIEEDEDNFSDDTGDTDELQEARTKDYHYSRAAHHGPYLKSRRQTEQLRKSHGRSAALRKRPLKLRTISGTGPRTDSIVNPGVTYSPVQDATTESISSEQVFTQTCEEVTDVLHQGLLQHGIDIVKNLIEYNIEWRRKKEQPQGCLYTPNQLRVLENEFFGLWAKMLVERRASTHTVAIVMFLKDFIQLGCLIVEQENTLSELYAQIMNAIFEQGELEIYKRNPKRPSRLAHIERLTRFEDYASEYGPEDDEVPQLQVEFQRLFSGLGGLEICMKAIEYHLNNSEQPEVRLLNLQLMLGLISRIPVSGDSEHSQISKLSDLSRRLVAAVLAVFPDHADSFRFVNKTTVLDIISQVGCFLLENYRLQGLHSNAVVEQDTGYGEYGIQDQMSLSNLGEVKFADFRLEMAVRLMKTSRLDLRLAGLIELKEVLVRIQRLQQGRSRLHRRSEADMDVQMEMDRKPIEHLCSKLQSMRIMGCIFGSNIHLEIVQRSTDVLVFLVQARVLTIDDIDLIWASVGGNQHPSIVHGVYQVLGELCSKLPQEFLRNLFIKLQAVALDSWDLQLVDLARSQFLAMVQRAKYNPEEGPISLIPYETLLNVLRNSTPPFDTHEDPSFSATTPSNRNVIAAIAQLLKEGLGVGPLPQDRMKLVGRCMQDLKSNHPGAIWSLQVVQHIFESHFINNESGSLQFYKQACSSLPELYISNLKAYTVALKATPPAVSPTASSFAQLSTHHLSQEYWRGLQLKIRLDFLKTIARIFPVYWNSPDLAETLWSCLIVDPISIQEQDETFACLEGIAEPQFVEYIYEILLPGLEVAAVTQKAWQCIKQYFLLLNWQKRNLVVATDPLVDGSQAIVVLAPLYGMDLIWEIALQARLPAVGANAIDLLSSLCKAHSGQEESGALEEIYEFREGLVETCIEHLVRSSDQLGGEDTMDMPDVSLVFERCIGILKAFLLACNAERSDGATRLEIHGTLDEDAMLTIRVSSNLPQFQVSIHPSATLASLRRMIATKLGCSEPEDVRLFSLGKDFATAWDSRTLEELHIDNCQSILASKRPQSAISLRPTPTMKRVPTDLLLQPSFFERVRRIFLLEERYASQAWEVVVRLPTSSVLLHSLESLQEDVDWTTVLDARSPFLLLYSLQIVNCLIKRDQCFEDPEKQIWIKRFLRLGGQRHLTALLMSESGLGAANTSPIARKALALMLKVLVRLTSSAEIESGMATDSNGPTVPEFLNKLVQEILTSASRTGGHDTNDQSIVLNAAGLISYLCAGPQGWHHFQAGSDIRSLIFVSMIQSESMQIRQTVLEMGKKFCSQFKNPVSADVSPIMFFLDILQSFLPVSKEYESNCSELFEFFEIIAREAVNYCSEDRFKALYTRLMETIIGHSSSEDMSMQKDDTILIGMLRVASAMINTDARLKQLYTNFRIIDYIMDDCLFPQGSHFSDTVDATTLQVAKCQSEGSRSAAFEFLEESAKGEPETLRHIIMKTRNQFARESEIEDQWGYDPQMIKKAGCGFVGLQNLGATCYVNSIIQQFFMNKEFRHGILDAPVSEDDPGRHDTLLYQLQVLFGHLQQSIKRAYNAHGFCYAYKDWDGNPMNVAVQMDVDEFFNILFDRLENSVKSTPQELLFKQQYGGKLVQQIKSKDCEHISEREDSFFSIQCEVKNKKTLEESLQLYVQGEILDGDNKYKCSSCDKHVDAIKRACIKELPQNLILHLKRFDYDMDTMRRIKINDRFEFPTRLDMEPYTLDYLTRKEQAQEGAGGSPVAYSTGGQENAGAFQYNLVGVLVHTGTADSGHYYSYIKDRSSDIPSGSSLGSTYGERTRWLFFNDSKVEEFDANEIPAKAFGGPEYIPQESSPYLKSPPRSTTKPYSAYMLFYERVDHRTQEPHEGMSGNVPVDIEGVVAKENAALLKDLVVFDRQYYRFIWELFNLYRTFPQQIDNDDEGAAMAEPLDYLSMQYGLDFFFSVLIHARDVDQELQQWTRFLSSLLAQYPKGCANFLRNLADNQTLLSNILLLCPITQVREAVVDLIYDAFHDLRECDKVEYGLTVSLGSGALIDTTVDSVEDDNLICIHGSPVHLFIQTLLRMLSEARANWRNFDEYFKLMYNITQLGRAERVLMAQEGYLTDLAEFYTFDERTDSKKKKMGDKFTKPSFHYLLLTIQEVLTTCDIRRSCEALQRRTQVQDSAHGPVGNNAYRKSSSSSSSTSSVLSSSNSDEVAVEDDMHIPSVSPELGRSVIISTADFNALFASTGPSLASERSLIFFTKMIADRTDSAIIARMVTHLSSHEVTGQRLLASLSSYLQYASEDQFTIIMQVFKELVQVVDENLEARVEFILVQLLKVLERSPQPSIAYDCLEFFRTISDYGQCGRSAQGWLLRNNRMWLQELLLMQTEPDTRLRARSFFMELLSSERAFNGWSDDQAAVASAQHFGRLLELLKVIPDILSYHYAHVRRDEDDGGWRFVEYFKALSELVKSDTERNMFFQCWSVFIDILIKIDSQQLNMDYDKKEMMVFWSKIMNEDQERNFQLAKFKPVGVLLRKFYVCLQNNPINVQFHREVLPIYFGLVLRLSKIDSVFHTEWVQCHNYNWALNAMKWGAFTQHCPNELSQLLQYTLSELPQYRQECWRMLPSSETPRFPAIFIQMATAMFEAENALAGTLFYQHRGLVRLTDVMNVAGQSGTATSDNEFFAVEALALLSNYLCQMTVCRNTPAFAEAMDHWSNIHTAIELLTGNLMWTAQPQVYGNSIKILEVIAKEATYTQAAPILTVLDKAHCELRDSLESGGMNHVQVQSMFGGVNSPYCRYGVLEARQALSSMGSPPMRIGPLIFMHADLFRSLEHEAAQQVLKDWFLPYWKLALSACMLDGGSNHNRKSIELGALLAVEQIPVGSIIHLEVLCEAVKRAADNEEIMLSLQNPYVALFMETFLRRDNYFDALTERHLSACAALLKAINLEESLLVSLTEENFVRAEKRLENDLSLKEPSEEPTWTNNDVWGLVTALQNLVILDNDMRDEGKQESVRLMQLQNRLQHAMLQVPEKYKAVLSCFLPPTSASMTANIVPGLGDVRGTKSEEAIGISELQGARVATSKSANGAPPLSAVANDEATRMTGILEISKATPKLSGAVESVLEADKAEDA